MKTINIELLTLLSLFTFGVSNVFAQEVDDMYFSASDRKEVKYDKDVADAANKSTNTSGNYYRESDSYSDSYQRTKNPDYSRYSRAAAENNYADSEQLETNQNTEYYKEDYKRSPYLDPAYSGSTIINNNYYGGAAFATPVYGYNSFYRPMAYTSGWNYSMGYSSGWGGWGNSWSFGIGYNSGFYGNRFGGFGGGFYDPFYGGFYDSFYAPFYRGGYGFNSFYGGYGFGGFYSPYAYGPYGNMAYYQGYNNGYYDAVATGYRNTVSPQIYNGPRQQRGGQVINNSQAGNSSSRGRVENSQRPNNPEVQRANPARSTPGPDYNNSRQRNAQERYSGRTVQQYGRETVDPATPSRQTDHSADRPTNESTPRLRAVPQQRRDNFNTVPGQNTQPATNPRRPNYNNNNTPERVNPQYNGNMRRDATPSRSPSMNSMPSRSSMPSAPARSAPSRSTRTR